MITPRLRYRLASAPRTPAEVKAGEFKAKCLDLMDVVAETGATITITKRGHAVARLVPAVEPRGALLGFAKGSFEELGDIIAPVAPEWRPDEDELARLASGDHPRVPAQRRARPAR